MRTFVMLGKYSLEGVRQISAARTQQTYELARKFQGEIKAIYALLGPYDLLLLSEFPRGEQAMQFSVALAKLTGITLTTLPTVPVEEFDRLMAEV